MTLCTVRALNYVSLSRFSLPPLTIISPSRGTHVNARPRRHHRACHYLYTTEIIVLVTVQLFVFASWFSSLWLPLAEGLASVAPMASSSRLSLQQVLSAQKSPVLQEQLVQLSTPQPCLRHLARRILRFPE